MAQELRGGVTLVWEIPAAAPERRVLLARIEHRDGYGPRLALSPDGTSLAAAVLPPGAVNLTTDAQVLALDSAGNPRVLATGADGQAAPVWRPDGAAVAFRRWHGAVPHIAVIEMGSEGQTGEYSWPGALHLSAVGWDADRRLVAVAMTHDGFDLVAPTENQLLSHLSDGPARGFALSPDRRRVSFLSDLSDQGAVLNTLRLADAFSTASDERQSERVFGAVWRQDGALVTGGAVDGLRALMLGEPVGGPAPSASFVLPSSAALDVPVAAGPGGWLAVRRLDGATAAQPARERLLLIGPGGPVPLTADGPLEAVGWIVVP